MEGIIFITWENSQKYTKVKEKYEKNINDYVQESLM